MHKTCPRCGGHLNPRLRGGGNIARPTTHDKWQEPDLVYTCTECRGTCYRAVPVYEDRIEWFFGEVMPKIGLLLVIGFVLGILAQLLGL